MLQLVSTAPAAAGPTTTFSARERAAGVALAALALFAMAAIAMPFGNWGDWGAEARPAAGALVADQFGHFLHVAPAYGASLLLRAPFMLATSLWHGGDNAIFRASAVPCLAAAGALGLWLSGRMRAKRSSIIACLLTGLACFANPLLFPALRTGHPEEILGAALAVGAVLCALDDRPTWAGVLLGMAVANKEWAVLATGPVLVALPRARLRTMLVAGATGGALMAPFLLGSSGSFAHATSSVGLATGSIFQPWQWWWFLGSTVHPAAGVAFDPAMVSRGAPPWLGGLGHTVPVAIMFPLTGLYAWQRRGAGRRAGHDALLLLSLVLALRCVLDPWDISYYALPFLFALTAWEVLGARRVPLVSLLGTFAAWLILMETGNTALYLPVNTQALIFILVSVPGVLALALRLYAPALARRVVPAVPSPEPVPAAA